jgi:SAM-dependent methyltransferase
MTPVAENVIRLLAPYSEGCRLAAEHGPTSGVVFEYACRNRPEGAGTLGRWLDRTFLQLAAWSNLRHRVEVAHTIVVGLVDERRAAGSRTVILDVASGTARYLRELVRTRGGDDLQVICRDRDPRQVVHGRELSEHEGLTGLTYSVGDATDQASYLTDVDPDVILAIGLLPQLQQDDAVRMVFRHSFAHLTPGGTFACTTVCDPEAQLYPWETGFWNPPALRPAATIAAWLEEAGFVDIGVRSSAADTFLIARKPAEA